MESPILGFWALSCLKKKRDQFQIQRLISKGQCLWDTYIRRLCGIPITLTQIIHFIMYYNPFQAKHVVYI